MPVESGAAAFQAHGAVLLLREEDLSIAHTSGNSEAVLGVGPEALLGTAFAALLAPASAGALLGHLPEGAGEMGWQRVRLRRGQHVKMHAFDPGPGLVGIDVIPVSPLTQSSGAQAVERVAQWTERLLGTTEVPELLQLATELVTRLSGFEGAWACRLEPQGHAVVLAATAPNTSSVVGQFVLATDIPPSEPRLHGRPVPFFVADLSRAPTELAPPAPAGTASTTSTLHRPYPAYLQRLHDIGVRSTLSVPVVIDGAVYARVIAHHPTALEVAPAVQAELRLLGAATSTHLTELLRLQETRERLDRATWSSRILEAIAASGELATGLLADPQALLGLCSATSAVVAIDDTHHVVGAPLSGDCPVELASQAHAALERQGVETSHSAGIHQPYATGTNPSTVHETFVAIRLGRASRSMVIWVRKEEPSAVTWVNHQAVDGEQPDALFTEMGERIAQQPSATVPWTSAQLQAVADFHAALASLIMARYQQIALLNEQLARSNTEFDAFAHAAAHDLKQPIRGIRQYTEFFLEDVGGKLTEDERDQLGTVLRLTGRMTDLLDGLMRYAELTDSVGDVEQVGLRAAVASAVDLLPPGELSEAAIEVQEAEFAADPAVLEQLLLNLIGNALKYSEGGRAQVWVGVTSLGETARETPVPEHLAGASEDTPVLVVSDRGVGIEERHQATVFQLFRQVHPDSPGSGAGLAICRRLARRYGGDIWLRSVLGEGTTFYVVVGA